MAAHPGKVNSNTRVLSEGWSGHDDEYHEDPVPDLCLTGFPLEFGSSSSHFPLSDSVGVGPTRPPDVLLPLTDPDWQCGSLPRSGVLPERKLKERIMEALSPSGDSGVHESLADLSIEEQEAQKTLWREEMTRVEEDIAMMRATLEEKHRRLQWLKHHLGITMLSELSDDINQGIKNVRESQVYQKTGAALKSTGERASGLFAGLGAKFSEARDSAAFKSVEERVGTMVTTVKSKVGGSHSNSTQSFDEALKEAEAMKKQAAEEPQTGPQ